MGRGRVLHSVARCPGFGLISCEISKNASLFLQFGHLFHQAKKLDGGTCEWYRQKISYVQVTINLWCRKDGQMIVFQACRVEPDPPATTG